MTSKSELKRQNIMHGRPMMDGMETLERLHALKSLQTRIREATGADRELDAEIAITLGMISGDVAWKITTDATGERIAINSASSTEVLLRDFGRYLSIPRYTTDPDGLGACVALCREVLPGYAWKVGTCCVCPETSRRFRIETLPTAPSEKDGRSLPHSLRYYGK